jgi:membrane associated rhomboid family serine protease
MHAASVGFHCPDCARKGAQRVYQGPAALQTRPLLTQILIGINVAVFIVGLVLTDGSSFGAGRTSMFLDYGLFGPLVPTEPYRLVTSGFLHSGIFHLGFNAYALWVLGRYLEPAIGRVRFGLVYAVSLLGGSLGVVVLSPTSLTVGASGAVFGLLGCLLVVARYRGHQALVTNLLVVLGINALITLGLPGISIGGHLGGTLLGLACGVVVTEADKRRAEGAAIATLTGLAVACALGAYLLMVAQYG